jgi:hypothetical protein
VTARPHQYTQLADRIRRLVTKRVRHPLPDVRLSVRLVAEWPTAPTEIQKTAVALAFAECGGRAGLVEHALAEGGPRA